MYCPLVAQDLQGLLFARNSRQLNRALLSAIPHHACKPYTNQRSALSPFASSLQGICYTLSPKFVTPNLRSCELLGLPTRAQAYYCVARVGVERYHDCYKTPPQGCGKQNGSHYRVYRVYPLRGLGKWIHITTPMNPFTSGTRQPGKPVPQALKKLLSKKQRCEARRFARPGCTPENIPTLSLVL